MFTNNWIHIQQLEQKTRASQHQYENWYSKPGKPCKGSSVYTKHTKNTNSQINYLSLRQNTVQKPLCHKCRPHIMQHPLLKRHVPYQFNTMDILRTALGFWQKLIPCNFNEVIVVSCCIKLRVVFRIASGKWVYVCLALPKKTKKKKTHREDFNILFKIQLKHLGIRKVLWN